MSTTYLDAALRRVSLAQTRDQIFNELCNAGWDIGTAVIKARSLAEAAHRDYPALGRYSCDDDQKDYDEYTEEMSIGGRAYRVPR